MNADELKEIIRTKPHVSATFADIDAEYSNAMAHADAINGRRVQLLDQLDAIEDAEAALRDLLTAPAEEVEHKHPSQSPVHDQHADEAIATIGRMRSVERLKEIIEHDSRVSVVEAAKERAEVIDS